MARSAVLARTSAALLLSVALAFAVAGPLAAQTPATSTGLSVTLADNNSTIRLQPGDRFLLNLGESYSWSGIAIDDQSVVSRVPGITVIRGAQGVYEAHAPGAAKLTTTGDPPCRQATPPCAAPSILFSVTIVVGGTAPTATPTAVASATAPVSSPSPVATTAPKPPAVGSGMSDNWADGAAISVGFAVAAMLAAGILLILVRRD